MFPPVPLPPQIWLRQANCFALSTLSFGMFGDLIAVRSVDGHLRV